MRGDLSVHINDGYVERAVTKYVTGLKFRKAAPGGFADASCHINLPIDAFQDLGPADKIRICSHTGRTVWEGNTNNPGATSGSTGEGFDLAALGAMNLASDRAERLIYLTQQLDNWTRQGGSVPSGTAETGPLPDTTNFDERPGVVCQFTPGQPITTGSRIGLTYDGFTGSVMTLGGVIYSRQGGITDGNTGAQLVRAGTIIDDPNLFTSVVRHVRLAGQTYTNLFPTGLTGFTLRLLRRAGGATNISTDDFWCGWVDLYILGHLMDRYGALRDMATVSHTATSPTTSAYVLAHEVVEDLLGRILTFCDPNASSIDTTTTYQIDQLAYPDAVTAAGVLGDLETYEPDYLWEILESNWAGKHRFNYRAWPTVPRYLIPPSVRVERPGSDFDLCNRIAVSWTDSKGNQQVTLRGAYVPELGNKSPILNGALDPSFVGRIRDAEPQTLPDGRGSAANARRLGDRILATKSAPPQAATCTVAVPIVDLLTGRHAQPWEIQPGYLARIQATGEDLRMTEMEYDDDSCTAALTLGEPVLTEEQQIAHLSKVVR